MVENLDWTGSDVIRVMDSYLRVEPLAIPDRTAKLFRKVRKLLLSPDESEDDKRHFAFVAAVTIGGLGGPTNTSEAGRMLRPKHKIRDGTSKWARAAKAHDYEKGWRENWEIARAKDLIHRNADGTFPDAEAYRKGVKREQARKFT